MLCRAIRLRDSGSRYSQNSTSRYFVSFSALSKLLSFSRSTLFSFFILGSLDFFAFVSFGLMMFAAEKPVRNNNGRRKNWCVFISSCLYAVTEKEQSKGALSNRVCCSNGCGCISPTKRLIRLITESATSAANCAFPRERLIELITSTSVSVFGGEVSVGKMDLLFL